jgi:hypothetical protein
MVHAKVVDSEFRKDNESVVGLEVLLDNISACKWADLRENEKELRMVGLKGF